MLMVLGLALTIDLFASGNVVDEFVDQHKQESGVFHLDIGTSFLHDDDGESDLLDKVDNVRIFSLDKEDGNLHSKEIQKFENKLKKKGFETYAKFRDGDSDVELLALVKRKKIVDWVMFVDGEESFFILEIRGRFGYEDLDEIGVKLEMDQAKYMKGS